MIIPIAFALTPAALRDVADADVLARLGFDGRRFSRAVLGAAFVATMLISWKFGGFVENGFFKGGFAHVTRTLTDDQKKTYDWIRQATAMIPRNASVGTSNHIGAHASNRAAAYFYPSAEHPKLDYVFIDDSELNKNDLDALNRAVSSKQLVELTRRDHLVLLKRAAP
jgi:hypothetical protein